VFKEWVRKTNTHLASKSHDTEDGDVQTANWLNSFQTTLDGVCEKLLGKKLVGPKCSPTLSPRLVKLNHERNKSELHLHKAVIFSALEKRRNAKELCVFRQIEDNEADSKLSWAGCKGITHGLKKTGSPPTYG
jgi:hypothetical protein